MSILDPRLSMRRGEDVLGHIFFNASDHTHPFHERTLSFNRKACVFLFILSLKSLER